MIFESKGHPSPSREATCPCPLITSSGRRWELVPGWRSETPQSELLSEPLGHPPRHQPLESRARAPARLERAPGPAPEQLGQLARARGRRLRQAREAVGSDRFPFILVGDKLNLNLPPQAEVRRDGGQPETRTSRFATWTRAPLGLNCRQTHCLECIKDVALDVEEHSREYEPWD